MLHETNCTESIDALYIGSKAHCIFKSHNNQGNFKVHSVFKRVINLCSNSGMLSLVTSEMGRQGAYLVIPELKEKDFLSSGISKMSCCKIINNFLCIDNKLLVKLDSAELWSGKLDSGFKWKESELNRENLSALRTALNIYASENSTYRKIYELKEQYLTDEVNNLCSINALKKMTSSVRGLVGFGAGLTPAGDDLLTGFLSVILFSSDNIAAASLQEAISQNLNRTNYISSNMLQNAIEGVYHEYIQDLVYAVACEDAFKVFECTKKLLKIGATSGTDLATGIYLGFNSISQGKAR